MTGLPKQFELGINEIDAQHVEFIKMLRELKARMGSSPRQEEICVYLERLNNYAKAHFKTEKEYMDRFKYPDIAGHLTEHAHLLQAIEQLEGKYTAENSSVAVYALIDFMETWLLEHIPMYDKKFAEYLRENVIE
ncbi:MAG: hemerythrin-like metal-binding protein [Parcubacteria group bacterium LiPW_15]|nr:MAG: hemerythrin-like metal-binding protein [Parcubacteria group bacterium LiPW_15]